MCFGGSDDVTVTTEQERDNELDALVGDVQKGAGEWDWSPSLGRQINPADIQRATRQMDIESGAYYGAKPKEVITEQAAANTAIERALTAERAVEPVMKATEVADRMAEKDVQPMLDELSWMGEYVAALESTDKPDRGDEPTYARWGLEPEAPVADVYESPYSELNLAVQEYEQLAGALQNTLEAKTLADEFLEKSSDFYAQLADQGSREAYAPFEDTMQRLGFLAAPVEFDAPEGTVGTEGRLASPMGVMYQELQRQSEVVDAANMKLDEEVSPNESYPGALTELDDVYVNRLEDFSDAQRELKDNYNLGEVYQAYGTAAPFDSIVEAGKPFGAWDFLSSAVDIGSVFINPMSLIGAVPKALAKVEKYSSTNLLDRLNSQRTLDYMGLSNRIGGMLGTIGTGTQFAGGPSTLASALNFLGFAGRTGIPGAVYSELSPKYGEGFEDVFNVGDMTFSPGRGIASPLEGMNVTVPTQEQVPGIVPPKDIPTGKADEQESNFNFLFSAPSLAMPKTLFKPEEELGSFDWLTTPTDVFYKLQLEENLF